MMLGESAFRPYYKPTVPHTAAGYENSQPAPRQIYSSPEPVVSSSPGKERTRRRRTTFTPEQTAALEREYVTDRYMDSSKRASLAESLSLNEVQVKTWFQNRRAKDKKEGRREDKLCSPGSTKADSTSSTSPPIKQENLLAAIKEDIPPPDAAIIQAPVAIQDYTPTLKAVLESPVVVSQDSYPLSEEHPVISPPKLTTETTVTSCTMATPTVATLATQPIPTSYADYLSLGLNPAMSISAPVAYSSIYDVYGNFQQDYTGLFQATHNSPQFFTALSTLDPQAVSQQPLANL